MKLLPWREHRSARAEYLDAVGWYDRLEAGLGSRLADELDAGVDFVREWPEAAAPFASVGSSVIIRRKSVQVFPFGIFYVLFDGEIVVLAYAHERRHPGYWYLRFKDLDA